jgi:hypothetical protein
MGAILTGFGFGLGVMVSFVALIIGFVAAYEIQARWKRK